MIDRPVAASPLSTLADRVSGGPTEESPTFLPATVAAGQI